MIVDDKGNCMQPEKQRRYLMCGKGISKERLVFFGTFFIGFSLIVFMFFKAWEIDTNWSRTTEGTATIKKAEQLQPLTVIVDADGEIMILNDINSHRMPSLQVILNHGNMSLRTDQFAQMLAHSLQFPPDATGQQAKERDYLLKMYALRMRVNPNWRKEVK